MPKSDFKFHTSLRVRWMECDAQAIVFNGSYMGYLEVGQAEYFRNLGFSIYRVAQRGYFDNAIAKTTIEYKAPARLDDVLELFVRVSHIGNTSYELIVEIYPHQSDSLLTTMHSVNVGYDAKTGSTRRVPDDIRELVNHYETTGSVHPLERFPELFEAASE